MISAEGGGRGRVALIAPEPLTHDAFEPFGEVLRPRPNTEPVTNSTFMAAGQVRGLGEEHAGTPAFEVLDYWPNLARLSSDPLKIGLLRPRHREARVSLLERHVKGTQSFIPLGEGRSVIVVGPPRGLGDPEATPVLEDLRAFLLQGGTGVNLRPGTWHWTPFPLAGSPELLILVRQDAAEDDLNYVDLRVACGTEVVVQMPT